MIPPKSNRKVAVITGANAGLGYDLAKRLIIAYPDMRLCLACRNKEKALEAVKALKALREGCDVDFVILDTSSIESVTAAAKDIRERYYHVDHLYLNAGMMKVIGVDWGYFFKGFFSGRCFHMFKTGEGLNIQEDLITEDGLQNVFETNVFGHYFLIDELMESLGQSNRISQIIWTSSSAARKEMFSLEDIQHKRGVDPYSSSKYATDILSVGLNERLNKQNIFSHSVCPGLVKTNLTCGIMPAWFWTLVLPLFWIMRIFVPSMTYTVSNGTEALFWLSHQDPASLDPRLKYRSVVSPLGVAGVSSEKMVIDEGTTNSFIIQMDNMVKKFKER